MMVGNFSLRDRLEGIMEPSEGKEFSFSESKLFYLWLHSLIFFTDGFIYLFIQYLLSTNNV